MNSPKRTIVFVGSFGNGNPDIAGGNLTVCRLLMASSFSTRLNVIKLDSTQVSLPLPSLLVRISLAAKRMIRFRRALREGSPDAVLIFSSSGLSFIEKSLMARLAAKRGIPVVFSIRDGNFMDSCRKSIPFLFLAKKLLKSADLVICQGGKWRDFYACHFGYAEGRCPILPNWTVTPDHLRIPIGRRGDESAKGKAEVTILFLGWVERFKGVFELLEVFSRMVAEGGPIALQLVVAGGGGALAEAKAWVKGRGLDAYVRFTGWAAPNDCIELFRKSDIYVLFSRTEGLPNSMVEAMGAGKPVVVTPVGSIPDVVRNGENGLIVPVGDLESMHAALGRLVRDPALRMELGENARKSAMELFTPETAASCLIELFGEAIRARTVAIKAAGRAVRA